MNVDRAEDLLLIAKHDYESQRRAKIMISFLLPVEIGFISLTILGFVLGIDPMAGTGLAFSIFGLLVFPIAYWKYHCGDTRHSPLYYDKARLRLDRAQSVYNNALILSLSSSS